MLKLIPLLAGGAFLAACNPAQPTDPAPATPPENAAASSTPQSGKVLADNTATTVPPSGAGVSTPRQLGSACGTLTAEGLCNVEFGMTAEEARQAHKGELYKLGSAGAEPGECYYLGPEKGSYDIGYMVTQGTVQRIDVRAPGVATGEAVQVGMPAGEVEGIYPGLERQPNKYSDRDDLIVDLEGDAKLIMEVDENGNIGAYRVGLAPAVDYVEGCA